MIRRSKSCVYHVNRKAMTGLDLCGHVDVKVPSKGRKFGQWKAWRRLWCVVRRAQGGSIQLIVGSSHHNPISCIDIPSTAVLCKSQSRSRSFAFGVYCSSNESKLRQPIVFLAGRSETETQEWMFKIRNLINTPNAPVDREQGELSVSLIDNAHSRSAGLAGLYGTLRTTNTGVTVSDPSTGQVRVHWRWTEILSATLASPTVPEDDKHILTVETTSEFSCGEGELQLFCLEGEQLTLTFSKRQSVCKPLPAFRVINSPLPPVPNSSPLTLHPLLATRRLSRSEGDLHLWTSDTNLSLFHLRTQSVSRNNNASTDRVASSLISAGLGLMLTTPGCSEPDSLHDYQCLDSVWPEDTVTDLPDFKRQQFKNNRRESGVSIASGIYEEIEENPDEFYEAMYRLQPGTLSDPPPLPPRKPDYCGSEEEYSTPDESLVYDLPKEKEEEEPIYLPMSAGRKSEDTYVVMANLINQNNHMSEPVT